MAKIYAIKERSAAKAMIVLVGEIDDVSRYVRAVPDIAWELLTEATDGSPLTLILQDGVGVAPNLLPQEALLELEML